MRLAITFVACLVLMHVLAGERGLPAVLQAQRDAQRLSREIGELRAENTRLRREATALRTDAATIERVARETLGLARSGEVVVLTRR